MGDNNSVPGRFGPHFVIIMLAFIYCTLSYHLPVIVIVSFIRGLTRIFKTLCRIEFV
jgi:hypothetical protein